MATRAAVFDFDGTLADSAALALACYNESAGALGVPRVGPDDVRRLRRLGAFEALAAMRIPPWKVPGIVRAVRAGMRAGIGDVAPFPGVAEALRELRARGVRCFVLSTNERESIAAFLDRHAIDGFEAVEGGAGMFGKAAKLRALLARCGVDPAGAAYVGDELRDIDAARGAGARSVAVAWGYGDRDALATAGPDALVESPAGLVAALAE